MQLTNQRKVYLGALVIAGAVLLADQVFMGKSHGPAGASAAEGSGTVGDSKGAASNAATPPTPAPAGSVAADAGAKGRSAASGSKAQAKTAAGGTGEPLAMRLERTGLSYKVEAKDSDPFHVPGPWIAVKPVETKKEEAAKKDLEGPTDAERFLKAHKLTTVMIGKEGSAVMVDSQLVKLGDDYDGFTLRTVAPGRAVFARSGQVVTLALDEPGMDRNKK